MRFRDSKKKRNNTDFVPSIIIGVVLLFLFYAFFIYEPEPIDSDTLDHIAENQSMNPNQKQYRYFSNRFLFQESGWIIAVFVLPFAIFLYQNRKALYRHNRTKSIDLPKRTEETTLSFEEQLIKNFPNLTAYDVDLALMIKGRKTSKEIAEALNISQQSANTARYRLRKKLKLNREDDLFVFLNH
jgi:DNA-binding CsgD family transcriptional regulator